jgi:hypothetical protein
VVIGAASNDHRRRIIEVGEANQRVRRTAEQQSLIDAVSEPGEDGREKLEEQILDEWGHVGQRGGVVRDGEW